MPYIGRVRFGHDSAVNKDAAVNTFAIGATGGSPNATAAGVVVGALYSFFNAAPAGQTNPIAHFLSPAILPSDVLIQVYGRETWDPSENMGSPLSEALVTIPAQAGGTALPNHLACVLSLEGSDWDDQPVELAGPPVTRPQSRRRGRLYLGPLNQGAAEVGGGGDMVPKAVFRSTVLAAAAELRDDLAAVVGGAEWGVWSRTNAAFYSMVSVSMDDRFDTLKSRKRYSGTRTRVLL